jgi:chemotaxis signal transduction protein
MEQIDPAPQVKMNIDREYIQGLGELDERMIVILDLVKMHDSVMQDIASRRKG